MLPQNGKSMEYWMNIDSQSIRIYLLGKFEIREASNVITNKDWKRRKAALLMQRLAYEGSLLKDQAIEFLWPETEITSGSNNLYRVIYSIRKTIDSFLGEETAEKIFSFENGILNLNDEIWVDSKEFETLCSLQPDVSPQERISRHTRALNLYEGDLLPDERYEEWTLIPREELMRLHREVRISLAKDYFERKDFTVGIGILMPLIARDAADETVHQELMRAYALSGRRHDALRQYQSCVDNLENELDISPALETKDLYNQIIRGELVSKPENHKAIHLNPPEPLKFKLEQSDLLVGRQPELEKLSAMIHSTKQEGQGRVVLIGGESGIGKTRLAMEALKMAIEAGMETIYGAAYEQEGRLPYQPFIEGFDHFLARKERSSEENPITHFKHVGAQDSQLEHWALFKSAEKFLLEITNQAPLLVLLDDLHAADETSLQLFHYLSRQTRTAPVLFVATYRIDSPAMVQFNTLLSTLYREGLSKMIALTPLNQAAVQEILEDIFQGKVDEKLTHEITEITSGNPFFAQEIGRALKTERKLALRGNYWSLKSGELLSVPENLSALLRQKVRQLGKHVEGVLSAAAVIGREFDFEILSRVVDLSNDEILNALDAALDSHLIEEIQYGYQFKHPLIRRTLYESLRRTRREIQHKRTAEAIKAVFESRPGMLTHVDESLAYHYDASDRRENALIHLIKAGENAADVYAFEVGIDYFERAISLMDELGLNYPDRYWYLLEKLGWWYKILADTPRSVKNFERALAMEKSPDWQPKNNEVVRMYCGAAVALITAGDLDPAEKHLESALNKMDGGKDAPEYADLWYNLAQIHWHRNEYQQAMQVAERSLTIAKRLNKTDAIARAYEMLALACHSLGEWQEGVAYERQRANIAGEALDVTDAFDVHL
jgi:DNA-binding SARP family transcriptional activator